MADELASYLGRRVPGIEEIEHMFYASTMRWDNLLEATVRAGAAAGATHITPIVPKDITEPVEQLSLQIEEPKRLAPKWVKQRCGL